MKCCSRLCGKKEQSPQKEKNAHSELTEAVKISEKLLKGRETLAKSIKLEVLDEIWTPFPDDLMRKDTADQVAGCTKEGSLWILRNTPSIDNYYDIHGVIGSPGSYGVVKRGVHRESKQEVAIKHIKKLRYKKRSYQHRYFTDLRNEVYLMWKAKDHPNIIDCYHVFESIDTLYLVLEYCRGGELYDLVTSDREQLNEEITADLFRQMVGSIYYLHSLNIAHCDLKPENFVFRDAERKHLVLIDFGMAKIVEFRKYFKAISGSPYYVAPEVLKNDYNEACDIWSLGVTLFVMMFGFPPFFDETGDDSKKVYKKIMKGFTAKAMPGYGAYFPDSQPVSEHCYDLIARLLRSNIADRLSAEEVLEHPWLKQTDSVKLKANESGEHLVNISNPAILNSLRFYKKKNVLHGEILRLLADCHYLNSNQQQSLQQFLKATDKNGDGLISKNELFDALKKIDEEVTMEDVDEMFSSIDANNDEFVSYEELLSSRINRKLNSKESRLKKVFASFDYNGDGKLTLEELKAVWESVEHRSASRAPDFAQLIKEVDTNGDGYIDYEEFLSAFGKKSAIDVGASKQDIV
mmetsp:Transcript_29982/g.47846  ORF Transcript_29982/g.47846 Transcript_29982/m.47846 type:complete len:577 (+) Transcript_29982:61-1791(+)